MSDLENVSVTLHVKLSFVPTIGLYEGPITKHMIAEHVMGLIETGGVEDFIDAWDVLCVQHENGAVLVENGPDGRA